MSISAKPSRGLLGQMAGRMLLQGATGFARLVTWVSLIGLVLGVAVLTLVVNVMNGFDHELRQRLLGSVPHITINQTPLDPSLAQAVAAAPEVAQASKYFQGFAVLSAGTSMQPVTMIGLAAADLGSMEQLQGLMRRGSLDDLQRVPNAILLGEPLARYQGLSLGDPVVLGVSIAQGDSVALRWLRLNLAGTFEMGAETDYSTVLVNLDQQTDDYWQALGQLGTRITLHQPMQASSLGARLSQIEASAAIETWEQTYGELFQAVRMEKSLMFFLLLLVVAIAGFNVIAGQSMVVLHKRSQIAMLRTIGATRGFVLTLFVFQGAFVAVTGTLGGLLLGLLMTSQVNELVDFLGEITGQHLLDGSFFAAVPTRLVWLDLTLIGVLSLSIALLSAWLPARGASQLPPARHLH